jgi:hypothetical protein
MRTECVVAMVMVMLAGAASVGGAACGNGVREGTEACDGADLGGQTCASVTDNFVQTGTLVCAPDCTLDSSDCKRAFLASLVPAKVGAPKNRCQLEWTIVGSTSKGIRQECSDGDRECDQDREFNNVCSLRVILCLNVPDPKVSSCAFVNSPGQVFRVEMLSPALGSELGQKIAAGVLGAASGLAAPAGSSAHASGNAISYSPPITSFACGRGTISIPLRGTEGHARPGKVRIRTRSADRTGKVRATGILTVICNP